MTTGLSVDNKGISEFSKDLSPQAGGNVDLQTNLLVGNGGSAGIAIAADGSITMAANPSVFAVKGAENADATGDGTTFTVDFTEVTDQGGDYADPTFTSPVDGQYLILVCVGVGNDTAAGNTSGNGSIIASNRTAVFGQINPGAVMDVNENYQIVGAAVIDMDANDTLTITVAISGGTKIVDVQGGATLLTYLSITKIS